MLLLKARGEDLSHASSRFWWLPDILDASPQFVSIFTWPYVQVPNMCSCLPLNVEHDFKQLCYRERIKVRWQLEDVVQRERMPLFLRWRVVEPGWMLLGKVLDRGRR